MNDRTPTSTPTSVGPGQPDPDAPVRLELRDLVVKRGGRPVLRGLSLEIRQGEVVGLLGPNGAGKTTAFRVLTGLLTPESGELRFDGQPMTPGDRRFRTAIGVVFQEPALDPRLSARENLRLAAGLYRVPRRDAARRIEEQLERAELASRADEPVSRLSGGMRRRVELARALIHEPRFLILDEPTTGLDEGAFRRFWTDLLTLRRERGLTLLLTTHRADEAEYCDRLAILDGGRLVACDSPERLRRKVKGDLLILDAEDPPRVAQTLADRLGLEPHLLEDKVLLRRDEAHTLIPRIVEALPPGLLHGISLRRTGLGEVFLELTGHELDGQLGEPPPGGAASETTDGAAR
jgi:ABC-2 type transport system ATP-binding protein